MSGYEPHDERPEGIDPDTWAGFLDDLQAMAAAPGDEVAAVHVAAAAAAVPSDPAATPGAARPTAPLWRRRTVFTGLFSTIIGKVLAGTMAVAAATAGVGAAGALPDPMQDFMDDHVFQRELVREQLQPDDAVQLQVQGEEMATYVEQNQRELQERARRQAQEPAGTQTQTQTQTQQQGSECVEGECGTQT
ncbi:MAG: hypothetical protein KQH83_12415, partial [Actinobacteria bacterium]|nr:hypothetical protein [Actinomycetota bacterium]